MSILVYSFITQMYWLKNIELLNISISTASLYSQQYLTT